MKNRKIQRFIFNLLLVLFSFHVYAENKLHFLMFNDSNAWVDSVMNTFSLEEEIAQMLMIPVYPEQSDSHIGEVERLIIDHKVGGLIFFKGDPKRVAGIVNRLQQKSEIPMILALDAEWGLTMRFSSCVRYPRQLMLGAIEDDTLIYRVGAEIALQLKRLGFQINFAPVADININPKNPVIGSRSFGEDKEQVTAKSIAYMRGMQDNGVIAVAKHFPGHGDTESDSHYTLPLISHSFERLDSVELYPFKKIINEGVCGVMVAHLNVPALDPSEDTPTSLSEKTVTGLLQDTLGFKGLIFTDALNMQGAVKGRNSKTGEIERDAFIAGNDILVMPDDVDKAIYAIKKAVKEGTIDRSEIDRRCRKILIAKYFCGLQQFTPIETNNLLKDLNKPEYVNTNRACVEKAITLLKNDNDLIPLKNLQNLRIASIVIGEVSRNTFQYNLSLYAPIDNFYLSKSPSVEEINLLKEKLNNYNCIIISIHNTDMSASRKFGISESTVSIVNDLAKKHNVILDVFASPYALSRFNISDLECLIMSYEDSRESQELSAQLIFGGIKAEGRLPVTATDLLKKKSGITSSEPIRFKYTTPEDAGMKDEVLLKIDSLVNDAVSKQAMPGCQVFASHNGKVFFNKSYGKHTYAGNDSVQNSDLYDIASLTKIIATVPAVMMFYDSGKIDIEDKISSYLPYLRNTNKADITIKDILRHNARLQPWIPFHLNTIMNLYPEEKLISSTFSPSYPFQIAENMYVCKHFKFEDNIASTYFSPEYSIHAAENIYFISSWRDTIFKVISESELLPKTGYKYSDLGFYLLYDLLERNMSEPFERYIKNTLFIPIGASRTSYLPLWYFPKNEIIPTEDDIIFRRQLVHGYVHDYGAAMLGGVCGHAGLFSNANDIGKIMQMYMNKGVYGGETFMNDTTVEEFTNYPLRDKENRRALGFDKPPVDSLLPSPVSEAVTLSSFGHTGFTGTMTWADPEKQIVYVFLSNRIHPDAGNDKIVKINLRTNIQKVIYEAIKE